MEKELIKFMENVKLINKDFSQYIDEEKGIEFLFNTVNAVANVDYLELDKQQYEAAKFQKSIDDLEYEIETIKKAVPKNEVTGKDEDKFTITEKDVAVRKIWNVSNRMGAYKSFTNKQSALECADNINKLIFDVIL